MNLPMLAAALLMASAMGERPAAAQATGQGQRSAEAVTQEFQQAVSAAGSFEQLVTQRVRPATDPAAVLRGWGFQLSNGEFLKVVEANSSCVRVYTVSPPDFSDAEDAIRCMGAQADEP